MARDKNGKWRTTNFDEGDNFGISGDRIRVAAASYLYDNGKDQEYIVLGGQGQLRGILGEETVASVIKNELMELKIPAKKIKIEEKSGNTSQQLKEAAKMLAKIRFGKISLISNQWHLPRVRAMIKYGEELGFLKELLKKKKLKLLAAESVAVKHQPEIWSSIVQMAYASEAMKRRIALEKNGIQQIKNGAYKF